MKYISFYDTSDNEGRARCLSAVTQMESIYHSLDEMGKDVEIVSASMISDKKHKARIEQISQGVTMRQFATVRAKGFFGKIAARIYRFFTLLFFLLFNVKKGENVIVYHSLSYITPIKMAKALKKFRLIMEIGEIYGDVINSNKAKKKEFSLFRKADAYIFSTEFLNEKINTENKPAAVIYGTYKVETDRKIPYNDGKIHCVYAGTLDPRKGCGLVVEAAEFLPENYHVHILGFGNDEDKKYLENALQMVREKTACTITYDGLRSGEEYIQFIQNCDIGLSPQNPTAAFNETSFPSKVLSYLANGLRVVSINLKSITRSAVSDMLYYYKEGTPQALAAAIQSVDLSTPYNSRERILQLDKEFKENMKKVLGEMV